MTEPTTNDQPVNNEPRPTVNWESLAENILMGRQQMLQALIDPRRDLDKECGYPQVISAAMFSEMAGRNEIAGRVVEVWPKECWKVQPDIYESEDAEETEFEVQWEALNKQHTIFNYLERLDILSGIGSFGVLLLGIDDGKPLDQPIDNIDERGDARSAKPPERELLYLRPFEEKQVRVINIERDAANPRFGQPTMYQITLVNIDDETISQIDQSQVIANVHWHRIIHVADNRKSSDVFGEPRQKVVFNRLCDLRKIFGGSAEMFWRGAFPGYSFEVNPQLLESGAVSVDKESMRTEFESFAQGMQRYMALVGVSAKSLSPQVADPTKHVEALIMAVCIYVATPKRVFMGSEQGELASGEDSIRWNTRVNGRQTGYLTPFLIRPFVLRLMAIGILPQIEDFTTEWPDMNSPDDTTKATTALTKTQALVAYVAGNVDSLMAPIQFMTMILDMTDEEAESVVNEAVKYVADQNERQAAGEIPGPNNPLTNPDHPDNKPNAADGAGNSNDPTNTTPKPGE